TPKGSTTSVIRGGYGMYYDKITMQTITPFVSQAVYSSSFVAQFPNSAADPGPSRGQLPTDPLLQSFACGPNAGAGATCGPVVNRTLLNSLFPPGSLGRNTAVVFLDNPDRVVPRTDQISLGYERQFTGQMAATVDYIHSWNRDQLITFDLNPGTRVDTSRTGRIVYTDLNGLAQQ